MYNNEEFDKCLGELTEEFQLDIENIKKTNIITEEDKNNYNLNSQESLSADEFLSLLDKIEFN